MIGLRRLTGACHPKPQRHIPVPQCLDQRLLKHHVHLATHSFVGANMIF
jgi:hypothetical protein